MMRAIAEQKGAIAQQSGATVEEPLPARPAGRSAESRTSPSDESCGFTPHDQTSEEEPNEEPFRWTDINGDTHSSPPGTMRSFGLNSQEFYEAVVEPRERPWIPNGALPREPRRPTPSSGVWVDAEDEDAAAEAVRHWEARVGKGRIG